MNIMNYLKGMFKKETNSSCLEENIVEKIPFQYIHTDQTYLCTIISAISKCQLFSGEELKKVLNTIIDLASKDSAKLSTIEEQKIFLMNSISSINCSAKEYVKIENSPDRYIPYNIFGDRIDHELRFDSLWYQKFFIFTFVTDMRKIMSLRDFRLFNDGSDYALEEYSHKCNEINSLQYCFNNFYDENIFELQKINFYKSLDLCYHRVYDTILENLKKMDSIYSHINKRYRHGEAVESFVTLVPELTNEYIFENDFGFPFEFCSGDLKLKERYSIRERFCPHDLDTEINSEIFITYPKIRLGKVISINGIWLDVDFKMHDSETGEYLWYLDPYDIISIFRLFSNNPITVFVPVKLWRIIIIYMIIMKDFSKELKDYIYIP